MKTRVITGMLIMLFFIPVIYLGDILFEIVGLLMLGIASYEMFNMFSKKRKLPKYIYFINTLSIISLYYILISIQKEKLDFEFLLIFNIFIIIINATLLIFEKSYEVEDFGNSFTTILYVGFGITSLILLRNIGLNLIVFLFAITVSTDVSAYITGKNFGKNKLAPEISPNKTVEGSLGGVFFACIIGTLIGYYYNVFEINSLSIDVIWYIPITILLSILSQIGDLVASKFKRAYGIKDFSNIFPGHGGILDRFDSALFTAMCLIFIIHFMGYFV